MVHKANIWSPRWRCHNGVLDRVNRGTVQLPRTGRRAGVGEVTRNEEEKHAKSGGQ